MQTALPPDPPRAGAASARGVAMPLIAAVLVMLTFVIIPPAPWDLHVDGDTSSSAVLNYAHQQGLQFGADIVYLYGPLGYLTYFYFSPHAAGMRMAVDTVLCFTVAAGVCLLAWRLRFVWRCLLLGIFMFLAANVEPRTDLVIDTGILCWGLLCFVESGRRLAVAVLAFAALAAFGSLAKTLVLLIAGLSVVLLAGDLVARGHRRLGVGIVAGFGAGVVLGWLASGQKLWGIGPCLLNALAVVQGYSQSLGWEALPQATHSGLLVMLAAMAMVLIRALTAFGGRAKWNTWRRGLLLTWLSALLFLTWKHGFARGDSYHLVYFFGFVPLLGLALEVLPGGRRAARLWARGLGAACCLLSIITLQSLFFPPGWKSLGQPFRAFGYHARCLLRPADYRQRMNALIEAKRGEAQLPRFRDIIGRASVDVFGQYAVYALLNDLNYRPRPVFQSYVACNTRLMRLNEQFYLSKAAPEYVMFGLGPIDHKFPPLEDAMVLRDLLINYESVAAEGGFLLLKSKSADAPRLTLLREGTVRPGEQIDLREFGDADLWLELDLKPTLSGRLRQFFYRPPTVRLAAWRLSQDPDQGGRASSRAQTSQETSEIRALEDARPPEQAVSRRSPWREPAKGLLYRRRAPAAMLAAGFVASPLLLRNEDVLSLYDGNPIPRPAAYSVELLAGEDHFWQPGIRFRVHRIENQLGRPARATLDWPGVS